MSRATGPPAAIAAGGLITAFFVAMDVAGPARVAVTIGFLLCGPGLAWVRLLRLPDPTTEWTIAVMTSIGIDVAVANVLLTTGLWTPRRAVGVIVVVAIAGSMVEVGSVRASSSSKTRTRRSPRWDQARHDRLSTPCPPSARGASSMVTQLPDLPDEPVGDEPQHRGGRKHQNSRGRGQRVVDNRTLDAGEDDHMQYG